jgi:hypothetical protein
MTIDQWVFRFAGIFVIASLGLGLWVHPFWFAFTAFVGVNMLQASFTGFCPLAKILRWIGLKPGAAFH